MLLFKGLKKKKKIKGVNDYIWGARIIFGVIFRPQHFHKKILCKKLLLVGKKVMLMLGQIRINNSLPYKICCENVVEVALLLFLLNLNSCDSLVRFNIFIIKVVKIG